jgi:hypothetical protein
MSEVNTAALYKKPNFAGVLGPVAVFMTVLVFATAASAGPVYRCAGADGKSVFQQNPCSIDSLDSSVDKKAAEALRDQDAVASEYAKRIKEVEALMENDVKLNQALEQKRK